MHAKLQDIAHGCAKPTALGNVLTSDTINRHGTKRHSAKLLFITCAMCNCVNKTAAPQPQQHQQQRPMTTEKKKNENASASTINNTTNANANTTSTSNATNATTI